jgi:hypothetical protein
VLSGSPDCERCEALLPSLEVGACGEKLLRVARHTIAGNEGLVAIRPRYPREGPEGGISEAELAAWPDVAADGFVVRGRDGDWHLSTAPLLSFDLFLAVDEDGTAHLSDSAQAIAPASSEPFDLTGLAHRFSGSVTLEGSGTFRRGVYRIAGGLELRFFEGRLDWQRWWEPRRIAIQRSAELNRCAETFRQLAEEAIERCLPPEGSAAVHLSGGRDSSLACALAARQLARRGDTLLALTALPCAGLPAHEGDYQFDEGPAAEATAKRFDNVEHRQIRPQALPLTAILDRIHADLGEPIHQPVSLGWAWPILQACGERGVATLLTGGSGNFTVSAGGLHYLSDLWREEGLGPWLRSVTRMMMRERSATLRDITRASFGGVLPRRIYDLGRKRGQPPAFADDYPLLKGALRKRLLDVTGLNDDPRPHPSFRAFVQGVAADNYNLLPVGRQPFNVEYRSPWDDRALFEFVLSMPASLLASAADRRLLYDRAFGDLLPGEVLRPARRGRQNVDFHAAFDPADLLSGIARYAASPLCRDMVDLDALARMAESWPKKRNTDVLHFDRWVGQFLPSVALASFLFTQDQGQQGSLGASARPAESLHAAL